MIFEEMNQKMQDALSQMMDSQDQLETFEQDKAQDIKKRRGAQQETAGTQE